MKIVGYDTWIDRVHAEYPDVDRKAITKLVKHGLGMMCFFQEKSLDVMLNHNTDGYYFYIGEIEGDPYERGIRSRRLIGKKSRLIHSLSKTPHDGYFYFGLTDEQYELHLKGIPISYVHLYKLKDELYCSSSRKHHFRVPRVGPHWKITEYEYETKDAEQL